MTTGSTGGKILGFNYAALSSEPAKAVQKAADRIKDRTTMGLIKTGQDLLAVKKLLNHGQFGAWLRAEFRMAERTAQRYMAAARLAAKCDLVADLSPTALHALSAPTTPKSAREKTIKRLEADEELGTSDVAAIIRKARVVGAVRQPTGAAKPGKPTGRAKKVAAKPLIGFTEKTETLVRKRRPPADTKYFLARIRRKGDRLVIVDVRPDKGSGHRE